VSTRAGRPRVARRALDSARRAPVATAALRRRIAEALASCTEEEQQVLALLVGERLSTAETALALEVPASRVMLMRAALFETLRRALLEERAHPLPRRAVRATPLRKAS